MATNSEARQASIRAVTSTTALHNEDWLALFAARSIPAGTFNERMLAYINGELSTSYTDINLALQAFASDTTGTYNEDWIKTFEEAGITTGTFSERMLQYTKEQGSAWDNAQWDVSSWGQGAFVNVNQSMAQLGKQNGTTVPGSLWSSLGTFSAD